MNPTIGDRIISILAYFTFGMFSIVWIVFANVTKTRISNFAAFNLYQAVFISILLAIFSLIYTIAINLLSVIPVIGSLAKSLDIFLNQTPIYYTFTLTGILTTGLLIYLSALCILGKKAYLPFVSEIVCSNFGG